MKRVVRFVLCIRPATIHRMITLNKRKKRIYSELGGDRKGTLLHRDPRLLDRIQDKRREVTEVTKEIHKE